LLTDVLDGGRRILVGRFRFDRTRFLSPTLSRRGRRERRTVTRNFRVAGVDVRPVSSAPSEDGGENGPGA